jgi:hypothetical protein
LAGDLPPVLYGLGGFALPIRGGDVKREGGHEYVLDVRELLGDLVLERMHPLMTPLAVFLPALVADVLAAVLTGHAAWGDVENHQRGVVAWAGAFVVHHLPSFLIA